MLSLIAAAAVVATDADPVRPSILYNRWQEDWSVLADPALRTDPLDAFKFIPLAPEQDKVWLTLGGGIRERLESNDAPLFATVPGRSDSYDISRLETSRRACGPLQAFVELQSDFAPDKRYLTPADSDRLDLEQAFVALVAPTDIGTFKVRVGRQQFAFDLQRFVSARDGPNVRQSFDAVWGDYETGPWRLIGYWSQPVVNRDDKPFDDYSSGHNQFYGLRIERHVLGGNELSAYWSRFSNDAASFLDARGQEQRDVWDLRFAGKRGPLDWDTEAMDQTGRVADDAIRAWALGSREGFTFAGAWTPRLGLQFDAASGDGRGGDRVIGTFNPLFPNGNYVTLAGYTGYVNFVHLKPSVTVHPVAGVAIMIAAAAQWRMTTADAVYTQPNIPVPHTAGLGERWTGAYGQIRTDWQATPKLSFAVEAVHFGVGETLRQAGGHDANYLGTEIKYGW